LLRAASGIRIASPTLSPDDLEMFYSTVDELTGVAHFTRSVRAAKTDVFPEGAVVPELDAACAPSEVDRHMDLSSDGLRAYIICTAEPTVTSGLLHVARRSSLGGSFTLDPTAFGRVGPSIAISKDELVAYSTTFMRPGPPLMFTRSDTSSPFLPGVSIPGLENVVISALDPTPDGLSLYGGLDLFIQVATRSLPSGPYGAPTLVIDPGPDHLVGAPEISQDCRSLYYVSIDQTSTPDVYSIQVQTR
jgi:hypothetical protein